MKAIKIAVVMILLLNVAYSLHNWLYSESRSTNFDQDLASAEQPMIEAEAEAASGLDLAALTVLVKDVRTGQELERRLNEKDGINNIDLNGDNQVDYLFVGEYGEAANKIGYSLTAQPEKGEVQEIADIVVEKNGDRAEIQVIGNEQIYGANAIFNDWAPVERKQESTVQEGGGARHSSYFFPHPLWISPFYFGYYPSFFSPFPIVRTQTYVNRVNRSDRSTTKKGLNNYQKSSPTKLNNPNKGKVANKGIARSLKNPTSTQRQFQTSRNKNLKSGGFGKTSRPASGTQVSKRSAGSSFGTTQKSTSSGSKSSLFGSRSRSFGSSSSGSFRSSSLGSRSFSFGK
jgi:hypothetical protein